MILNFISPKITDEYPPLNAVEIRNCGLRQKEDLIYKEIQVVPSNKRFFEKSKY